MIQERDRARRLEALYAELQPQLMRILVANLQAPEWLLDEACQAAWGSLLLQAPELAAGGELGWLSTTASRAALRLLRRERFGEPHEQLAELARLDDHRTEPDPQHALEVRERLAEIRRLPVRQQRVLMLQGFGYEYDEIAAATGETRRTVTRQLTRARQRLLRLADER